MALSDRIAARRAAKLVPPAPVAKVEEKVESKPEPKKRKFFGKSKKSDD